MTAAEGKMAAAEMTTAEMSAHGAAAHGAATHVPAAHVAATHMAATHVTAAIAPPWPPRASAPVETDPAASANTAASAIAILRIL